MILVILFFLHLASGIFSFVITPTADLGVFPMEKACDGATCFVNTSVNCCAAGCQKCFGGGFEPFPPIASCRGSQCDQGCPGGLCPCASCTCCFTSISLTTATASLNFEIVTEVIVAATVTITTTVLSPVIETSTITFTQISEVLFSRVVTETTTDTNTVTSITISTSSIIFTSTVFLTTVVQIIPVPVATTTDIVGAPHLAFSPTPIIVGFTTKDTSIFVTSTPLSSKFVNVNVTVTSSTPPASFTTTTLFVGFTTTTTLTSTTSVTSTVIDVSSYINIIISYSTDIIDVALIDPLLTTTIFPGAPVTASTTTLPTLITTTVTVTGTTTTTTLP